MAQKLKPMPKGIGARAFVRGHNMQTHGACRNKLIITAITLWLIGCSYISQCRPTITYSAEQSSGTSHRLLQPGFECQL
jgi:hypothetical protein